MAKKKAKATEAPGGLRPGYVCMTGPGGKLKQVEKGSIQEWRDQGWTECLPPKGWDGQDSPEE